MEKLQQIVRRAVDILSTRSFSSRRGLRTSLDHLDARQRYYIRETLECVQPGDQTSAAHLAILKHLVDHWRDQDMATKVAVLWCVDSLPEMHFARAAVHGSPDVSEILGEIQERLDGDCAAPGRGVTAPAILQEDACASFASHSS